MRAGRGGSTAARRWFAAVGLTLWVIVQLALPTRALLARGDTGRAQRFGWQMYTAGPAPSLEFDVVTATGGRQRFTPGDVFYRTRAEIDAVDVVVAHLCREVPGARRIEVRASDLPPVVRPC